MLGSGPRILISFERSLEPVIVYIDNLYGDLYTLI